MEKIRYYIMKSILNNIYLQIQHYTRCQEEKAQPRSLITHKKTQEIKNLIVQKKQKKRSTHNNNSNKTPEIISSLISTSLNGLTSPIKVCDLATSMVYNMNPGQPRLQKEILSQKTTKTKTKKKKKKERKKVTYSSKKNSQQRNLK